MSDEKHVSRYIGNETFEAALDEAVGTFTEAIHQFARDNSAGDVELEWALRLAIASVLTSTTNVRAALDGACIDCADLLQTDYAQSRANALAQVLADEMPAAESLSPDEVN